MIEIKELEIRTICRVCRKYDTGHAVVIGELPVHEIQMCNTCICLLYDTIADYIKGTE